MGDVGGKKVVHRHKEACILWEVDEHELYDVDTKANLKIFLKSSDFFVVHMLFMVYTLYKAERRVGYD